MTDHTERVTITDALPWDCVEGECEHSDEADMGMWENCPKITVEVCVDCMDDRGLGRDPRWWEELTEHETPQEPESPLLEPAIFKPSADVEGGGRDA